ncbi:DUF1735 domain-containing protein [Spirosoma sp. KUDC1026]|uniref:DUF1735 domain-containing protein n=1 Tax=Spirosoma sp. KUDC1026 TaxID=2745947 RepID=UPI00159BC535|nr:DUF1735 domain-containing protein [Spirosoma sp. KUDC1026]QKZ11749.1 DUF1735 domain-containing protein [Spirosoma sp. KUDC1026]
MKLVKNIIGLFVLATTLSSCLKDTLSLDPATSTNVIEFKNPSSFVSPYGSKYALYTRAFDLAAENEYPVTVSYSGANVAPEDITVTLGTNEAALTQYNTEQHTTYDLIPATLYSLPASVVIPKGQRTATVALKVKSNQFDFTKNYVLPIQIKTASTGEISGNFGTILLSVNAKNKYDGVYSTTGTMVDVTNAAFKSLSSAGQKVEYTLETISATKCVLVDNVYYGSPITPFWTGTGVSGYGSFSPVIEFDPATDKIISVTNYYGQPAGNTRSAALDPTGTNTYTASNKTIKIKYQMKQPSAVAASPNIRVTWDETWTYLRAR